MNAMNDVLKPWYAVAIPHEDIREGRLAEAIFAANLWAVVQETAPEIYLNAEEFFGKTYLTTGLSRVLNRVTAALQGGAEAGDRIISLQTSFGGGKTHTLVALWHLARNAHSLTGSPYAKELLEAVGGQLPENIKSIAVFTNHTCDATQGREVDDGIQLRTLWGELAYQLGGRTLYERIRANDESRHVPQGVFVDILRSAAPCLILLDELADYCVGAAAVSVGQTSLADQTISFIQQLTESVQQVPGAVVVATLPASKLEVAQSEKGQEAFTALEKRFQRLGADVKPVADNEIYEVVRARLFESIVTENEHSDYPKKVARAYHELYKIHSREVSGFASKKTYQERIQRAYPFHPLLIDTLYTRWGSHPDLQRTRGVLRLLATIVGDLWQRRRGNVQTQHLIQPCHINWAVDSIQAALTRLWGPAYQSVVAADVTGERANSVELDDERGGDYLNEAIGEGLASAILLGSFGGQGSRSGYSSKEIKLACSREGINWNYVDGALLELENRGFYLHTASAGSLGKRYWFGTRPTLNKLVVQYRQQIEKNDLDVQIIENLRSESKTTTSSQVGTIWRIVVDPTTALPEQKSLALLILPPSMVWNETDEANETIRQYVNSISTRCGQKDRLYRNTLLFLAATKHGLARLRKVQRTLGALYQIRSDYWDQLDHDQQEDLTQRLEAKKRATLQELCSAYTTAIRITVDGIETVTLPDTRYSLPEHLDYLWTILVEDEEWILRRVGSVTLDHSGLIPKEGALRLKDSIEAFLRFTDKPIISNRRAVTDGLSQACADGLVGLGRGGNPKSLLSKYCKQTIELDPSEDGIWIIPPFESDVEDVKSEKEIADVANVGPKSLDKNSEIVSGNNLDGKIPVTRLTVHGKIQVEHWGDLFQYFVHPGVEMNLKKMKLHIHFEMIPREIDPLHTNDKKIIAMKESASQLGLKLEIETK